MEEKILFNYERTSCGSILTNDLSLSESEESIEYSELKRAFYEFAKAESKKTKHRLEGLEFQASMNINLKSP